MSLVHSIIIIVLLALANKLINAATSSSNMHFDSMLWVFFGLIILVFIFSVASNFVLAYFGNAVTQKLYEIMIGRVLATPYEDFERLGQDKIHALFNTDIKNIYTAFLSFPPMLLNFGICFFGFIYLGVLSPILLGLIFCLIVLSRSLVGKIIKKRMRYYSSRFRELSDVLYKHFNGVIYGNKELKLNSFRESWYLRNNVIPNLKSMNKNTNKLDWYFGLYIGYTTLTSYTALALIIVISHYYLPVTTEILTGYAMVLFFLRGPLFQLIDATKVLVNGRVSMSKVDSMGLAETGNDLPIKSELNIDNAEELPFVANYLLRMKQVEFIYNDYADELGYHFGPVDLELGSGEIIFIIGGNGSGKSTLAKLLVGLYRPMIGSISLNGEAISEHNELWYRNHFSAIFSDFYLFEQLLDESGKAGDKEKVETYLESLLLRDKVNISDGIISTTKLSQGQRKRLALLHAYSENRPILLFDEWASDQDPIYKHIFYEEILPDLKRKGKCIIVISHDDRYFHCADKIIKLENGQITEALSQNLPDTERSILRESLSIN